MKRRMIPLTLLLLLLTGVAFTTTGCTTSVGVGVSYGYPGAWGGPWGGPMGLGGYGGGAWYY
jgi:predicted small secreted protein